jgi:beta-glucanase (GH16 family)
MSTEPCGQANPISFKVGTDAETSEPNIPHVVTARAIYAETRMSWDPIQGNGPAFWLFSSRHATNPSWPNVNPYCAQHSLPVAQCWSAEIDIDESYGGDPNVFTGTIHRNSSGDYGRSDQQNGNNWQDMGHEMYGWHTVAALWTATAITWYVDGAQVMSAPVYDSTPQPQHLILYNWNTDWEPSNTPNLGVSEDAHFDWVRVIALP